MLKYIILIGYLLHGKCIQHIRLYICTENGEIITLRNKKLNCTLHIEKNI